MGSHSVTFHQTQVNTPRCNPSQAAWYTINLPQSDERLSCTRMVSSNRIQCRAPSVIKTNVLTTTSTLPMTVNNVSSLCSCCICKKQKAANVFTKKLSSFHRCRFVPDLQLQCDHFALLLQPRKTRLDFRCQLTQEILHFRRLDKPPHNLLQSTGNNNYILVRAPLQSRTLCYTTVDPVDPMDCLTLLTAST